MPNVLYQFLAKDHDRLDDLFHLAVRDGSRSDLAAYEEFRKGLFRHISIEEKIVYPTVLNLLGVRSDPVIAQLRLDHSAVVMLLVPVPSPSIFVTLSTILAAHNELEEQAGGVYELLGRLPESRSHEMLEQFRYAPDVPLQPLKPLAQVIGSVQRVVERSGHKFIDPKD